MNRTAVEQIKERLPIDVVVGQYVKLEKSGKTFKAKCPFHNEKSASFFVSPDRGGYYCFGCNAKGDIFTFVEQFEGLDFRGALKILAEKAGVPLVFDKKADGERDQLLQLMEDATAYFEAQLEKSAEAKAYVTSRGITDETRKEFRIGWAPEGWSNVHAHLKGKGWNDFIIEKAGLAKKGDKGDFYDRFRGRVMFPISDSSGRTIAFSGRILKADEKSAKYINSPDTPLYDKSQVLYGLDKAKAEIRRLNYSILVEGQMDLVMSHQAGVKNTVAASGTALTEESFNEQGSLSNLGLVRRLSPNIIVAFDSDSAGRKAALRASGIALTMGMDVKIADIEGGKDPADLVLHSADDWKNTLRAAKQVVEFEIDNVAKEVTDRKKLPRVLQERVFPLLVRLESSTERSRYVAMVSEKTGAPSDAVWQDLRIVETRLKQAQASATPASSSVGSTSASSKAPAYAAKTSAERSNRIDLIERRMFGLLILMEAAGVKSAPEFRERIRVASGLDYDMLIKKIEPLTSDISFEAEAVFGNDQVRWDLHMPELVLNFEEDLVSEQLVATMQELKSAEKAGDASRVGELAKMCQELSIKKAEIAKRRK